MMRILGDQISKPVRGKGEVEKKGGGYFWEKGIIGGDEKNEKRK